MKRKTHQDRIALIDRLEKKYSQKLEKLYKHRKPTSHSSPAQQGIHLKNRSDIDYETIDGGFYGRTLAY